LSYAQAAELTWPQLMHAMGIDSNAREDDSAARLAAAQDAIFEGILALRRCLPVDLIRMPVGDLVALVKGGGKLPKVEMLLGSLNRFIRDWTG
jgi:hypothetical protein